MPTTPVRRHTTGSDGTVTSPLRNRRLSAEGRMEVAVRVRPLDSLDHGIFVENNVIRHGARDYPFDAVMTGDQDSIYKACGAPMVRDAIDGYNTCLFAYGQTGSGKTYTLLGLPGAGLPHSVEQSSHHVGLLPRFLEELSGYRQQQLQKHPSMQITMAMSVLEIYNEEVRDLLRERRDSAGEKPPTLVEDTDTRQIIVVGAVEAQVDSSTHAMQLLHRGVHARETAPTKMNDQSSRSHMIVIITFKQRHHANQGSFVSNIKFVDLAGSECLGRTGTEGIRRREGGCINKSLLALGKALNSFSTGAPMHEMKGMLRESKLTRLLSENFGGNSKTRMLAMVSPAVSNDSQTISTLSYAMRAKNIALHATQNKLREAEASKVKQLQHMLNGANAELEQMRESLRMQDVLRDNLEAALHEVSTLRAERDTARDEMHTVQAQADTKMRGAVETLEAHAHNIEQLKVRVSAADQAKEATMQVLSNTQQRVVELEQELIQARELSTTQSAEMESLHDQLAAEMAARVSTQPPDSPVQSRPSRSLSVNLRTRKMRRSSADLTLEKERTKRACTERAMASQLQRIEQQKGYIKEDLQQQVEKQEATEKQRRSAVAVQHSLEAQIAGLSKELREERSKNAMYAALVQKQRCEQCKKPVEPRRTTVLGGRMGAPTATVSDAMMSRHM